MVTYPSTHGVFEEGIVELCELVHEAGGQVYVDGANLNALLGLARPGSFGADVSHLNLHKTFCIPHGGGGPGVGPVALRAHLAPFLPSHPLLDAAGPATGIGPISAAPYGSAGILPISFAYIAMMGADGLTAATEHALLAANYVATRLHDHYPGALRRTQRTGRPRVHPRPASADQDQWHHRGRRGQTADRLRLPCTNHELPGAPARSMVEPTESENLEELDRFCDAMIDIRARSPRSSQESGRADDNPLVNAPHTQAQVTATTGPPVLAAGGRLPGRSARRTDVRPGLRQVLAAGWPHRRRLR